MPKTKIDGFLPRQFRISKSQLKTAADFFAACSARRARLTFREVVVVLQDDEGSGEVHLAINGVEGPTDVVTQPYDPMPNEPSGVYGELYVNVQMALRTGKTLGEKWSPEKELLLYIAHGMDHLSGAQDLDPSERRRMRRRELRWMSLLAERHLFEF